MRKIICALLYFLVFGWPISADLFFKNSDHELEVIRIKGEAAGLTLLIFGGIHGDEPGGHFAPEILAEIQLSKGNLIVVPRANFAGIMTNQREIYGDMNRKFIDKEYLEDPDSNVIQILKDLMKEADIFLNLHDAYGFHRDEYISKNYNPYRYGQSLIVDTARFYSEKLKKEINLEEIGRRIVDRVNSQINSKKFNFCFWNHNSVAADTRFVDMQKSATYYAVTKYSIPGFGLETSRDLPSLSLRVKHQLLVIKEVLNEFGFEYTLPTSRVRQPLLYWLELVKNGKDIIRVNNHTNVRLFPGDRIRVQHIFSNYKSGLSANILKWGSLNDVNRDFIFQQETRVIIKKNHVAIGTINLKKFLDYSIRNILIDVNGEIKRIPNWGKIELEEGHYFNIKATTPSLPGCRVDVRGFSLVPGMKDDANVSIYAKDLLPGYSFKNQGKLYFARIYDTRGTAGGFQLEIIESHSRR